MFANPERTNTPTKAQSLPELHEIDEQFQSQLYSINEPMENMYLEGVERRDVATRRMEYVRETVKPLLDLRSKDRVACVSCPWL